MAASRLVPQARCRSRPGVLRIEAGGENTLAREVVVPRVLDDGARGNVSQPRAEQAEALHQRAQDRGEHLLVADRRVGGVRPRERYAHAAHDGDAPHCCAHEHGTSARAALSRYATIARSPTRALAPGGPPALSCPARSAAREGSSMGDFTTLMARDGHEFQAYLAAPPGRPRGAVVVLQEIFGVNRHIRAVTDGFAAEGYTAIAPGALRPHSPRHRARLRRRGGGRGTRLHAAAEA